MNIISILLMAQPQEGSTGNMWTTLLPLLLLFVVFWLFFIRPQSKKAKEQQKFRDELKKGDKVVTIGGIHGKIDDVKDHTVMLSIDNNVKIEIEKTALVKDATQVGQA
jgi:preprotein translocase, YajC subunit